MPGDIVIRRDTDFREGAFRHFTKRQILLEEFQAAGYTLATQHGFLPRQNFLVFSRVKK